MHQHQSFAAFHDTFQIRQRALRRGDVVVLVIQQERVVLLQLRRRQEPRILDHTHLQTLVRADPAVKTGTVSRRLVSRILVAGDNQRLLRCARVDFHHRRRQGAVVRLR